MASAGNGRPVAGSIASMALSGEQQQTTMRLSEDLHYMDGMGIIGSLKYQPTGNKAVISACFEELV
jgi:hypothetical protein